MAMRRSNVWVACLLPTGTGCGWTEADNWELKSRRPKRGATANRASTQPDTARRGVWDLVSKGRVVSKGLLMR